jgi:LmbE family N-acetylglucosaminyl deacetylase
MGNRTASSVSAPLRWLAFAVTALLGASFLLSPWIQIPARAAEPNETISNAIEVKQALDRLPVAASVLMIAAHPDDENTGLIAYVARGRNARMAYLSLTRGEGGQNVIGPEQGPELGLLRTEELLQSRRTDGGEQFFSRAIDFGFTKSSQETLEKWGHDAILGDIVWVIRRFRPDVVILQFTGTKNDGHGQHQASSILGREAFAAAADPHRFPEQLKYAEPWAAARLMMNRRGFTPEMQKEIDALPDKLELEIGAYDPLIGYSYGELAGVSRSFNSSQSDGTPRTRGSVKTTLVTVAGSPAKKDLFDGIDTTWARYPGGAPVGKLLEEAARRWSAEDPSRSIPALLEARELASQLKSSDVAARLPEIDEAIGRCAGFWLDFSAASQQLISGEQTKLRITALARNSAFPITLTGLRVNHRPLESVGAPIVLEDNKVKTVEADYLIAAETGFTQPYWLKLPPAGNIYQVEDPTLIGNPENAPALTLQADVKIGAGHIALERPIVYRYMDRQHGESVKPVAVVPPASVQFLESTLVFPTGQSKTVELEVVPLAKVDHAELRLRAPAGWQVTPASKSLSFVSRGQEQVVSFQVAPAAKPAAHVDQPALSLAALLQVGDRTISVGIRHIDYPHIPLQTLFPPPSAILVRTDAVVLAHHVGYVMGAGDEVPGALRQLGCDVDLLSAADLSTGDLSRFDAIVTGIRAYTERPDLVANQSRLLDYVSAGGTLIVQYNRIERDSAEILKHLGPYPFEIANLRVTVEEQPVAFDAANPLLRSPNRITDEDFAGWVQERGLYFARTWDPRYETPFETHDPGEQPLKGGTLVAHYGKGTYIFTAFAWFRQLPAGVPGAYRVFANFLSASKTAAATTAVTPGASHE